MKSIDETRSQIETNLQLLKESMDADVRERAFQDILESDRDVLYEIYNENIRNETDPEVLGYLAEILVGQDSISGVIYLLPLLNSQSTLLRRHICGLLSNFSDSRTVEPLIRVLQSDNSADVRVIAVFALGKIRDERALPALRVAQAQDFETDFEGTSVSSQAADAIAAIEGE